MLTKLMKNTEKQRNGIETVLEVRFALTFWFANHSFTVFRFYFCNTTLKGVF
jgi:hypothetical protein